MAFYTVLTPPPDPSADPADHLGRSVFLKDGFAIFAFIFTGLWLLSKRLWLALAIFLAVSAAIALGGRAIGVNATGLALAQALTGLFLGFEGRALLERKLLRKGWTLAGVVEGRDIDTVERRFFESLASPTGAAPARAYAALMPAHADQGVLGLFPEPKAR